MDEVLGQRHSITPPVLIASMPEDTPGPSTAVVDQEVEDEEEERQRGPRSRQRKRKRGRDRGRGKGAEITNFLTS
ncbi:unnamed protein product [Gadus morhua 'NCC']